MRDEKIPLHTFNSDRDIFFLKEFPNKDNGI